MLLSVGVIKIAFQSWRWLCSSSWVVAVAAPHILRKIVRAGDDYFDGQRPSRFIMDLVPVFIAYKAIAHFKKTANECRVGNGQ